jgi:hypothetical protein
MKMKNSVKRLLEGSPSKFFGEIRTKLDAKATNIVESVASTVADTVFEEGKKADRDEDKVTVSNKNIQKNIENKEPERIKNKKAISTMGESIIAEKQDVKMLGRYRVVHKETGAVMGSHDDKAKAIEIGRKAGAGSCRLVDTNKGMNEDLGAHTISTKHGGKHGKSFTTFVVNKKRVSKEASQRKWQDMIKKATPKETVWDKHTKQ